MQLLVSSLNDPKQKSLLAQLQALLGVCQSRLGRSKSGADSDCWQQLQESGIFVEDDQPQHQQIQASPVSTQTEQVQRNDMGVNVAIPIVLRSEIADKSVQAVREMRDSSTEAETPSEEAGQDNKMEIVERAVGSSQTEEQMMTLTDFKDIELYYVEQIELLQKEKASHRKKIQSCKDETAQAVQQLELLNRQFYEREKQFEDILQKNCEAFERELEAVEARGASSSNEDEVSALVWQEIKDYVSDDGRNISKTSGSEFVQAMISSLHGMCSELGQLRARVAELADMEQAFQTTLQQADGLVHHIEEKHLRRIRELELNEQELRRLLEQMQQQIPAGQHCPTVRDTYQDDDEEDDGSLQFRLQGSSKLFQLSQKHSQT